MRTSHEYDQSGHQRKAGMPGRSRTSAIQQQDVGRNETPERFAGGSEAQCLRRAIAGGDATGNAQRVPLAKVALAVIEDVLPSAHLAIFRSNICVRHVVP